MASEKQVNLSPPAWLNSTSSHSSCLELNSLSSLSNLFFLLNSFCKWHYCTNVSRAWKWGMSKQLWPLQCWQCLFILLPQYSSLSLPLCSCCHQCCSDPLLVLLLSLSRIVHRLIFIRYKLLPYSKVLRGFLLSTMVAFSTVSILTIQFHYPIDLCHELYTMSRADCLPFLASQTFAPNCSLCL